MKFQIKIPQIVNFVEWFFDAIDKDTDKEIRTFANHVAAYFKPYKGTLINMAYLYDIEIEIKYIPKRKQ